jgi:hypothetical protein
VEGKKLKQYVKSTCNTLFFHVQDVGVEMGRALDSTYSVPQKSYSRVVSLYFDSLASMQNYQKDGGSYTKTNFMKHRTLSRAPVAHACNPSYSGGRHPEDYGSKTAPGRELKRPYL